MAIKNLTKAAQRIKKAIKNKERIILYGDGDLDGICSVIILKEAIMSLGGQVSAIYFPDREKEGYGITPHALNVLGKFAPAVFIAMDLGISNFREVEIARRMGFEILIIDHHEIVDTLPRAHLIVNPKQHGDRYPFKEFAACGLTFRLAQELIGKKKSSSLEKSLVELGALGTIADMMPRKADNLAIIDAGLLAISESWRPGIKAFLESEKLKSVGSVEEKIAHMISVLNVRDVKNGIPAAFRILTTPSLKEAKEMLSELEKKHKIRQERIQEMTEEIKHRNSSNDDPILFEGDSSFDFVLLGAVASRIVNEFQKPVFLYKKGRRESIGSVRAPAGYDTVKAMKHCSQFLLTFGGHPPASGFRIKNEHIEHFKKCLIDYFHALS